MSTTTDLPPVQKAPEKHGEKSHQSSQTTLDVHPTKPDFNSGLNLGIKGAIANAQLSVDKNFGDLSFTEPGSDHATDRAQTQLYRYTDLITRKSADAGQKVVDGTGHGGAGSDATCKPAADAAENKSCDNNQKESDKKKTEAKEDFDKEVPKDKDSQQVKDIGHAIIDGDHAKVKQILDGISDPAERQRIMDKVNEAFKNADINAKLDRDHQGNYFIINPETNTAMKIPTSGDPYLVDVKPRPGGGFSEGAPVIGMSPGEFNNSLIETGNTNADQSLAPSDNSLLPQMKGDSQWSRLEDGTLGTYVPGDGYTVGYYLGADGSIGWPNPGGNPPIFWRPRPV